MNETDKKRKQAMDMLSERVDYAVKQHPDWAGNGKDWAGFVISEEMRELRHAIQYESRERQVSEALDVAATCIRFIAGEHL